MIKLCPKCNKEKFFTPKGKRCQDCNRAYQKQHYLDNKDVYTSKALNKRQLNQEFMLNYLRANACVDCGEDDIVVLEFDHLGDKVGGVAKMVRDGYGLETIKKEIAKCDVVCANCHKRRTYTRCGSYRYAPLV